MEMSDQIVTIKSEIKVEEGLEAEEQYEQPRVKIKDEIVSDGEGAYEEAIVGSNIAMELQEPELVQVKAEPAAGDARLPGNAEDEQNEDGSDSDDANPSNENFDDDIPNYCKVCQGSFDTDEDYRWHYKAISTGAPRKPYGCCSCKRNFRDLTQIKVHQRRHTGEKPYSCDVCNKKFSVSGNMVKHKLTHTGERPFECDTCHKKFTQFAHLEDHMKAHSGERAYKCDQCGSSFKRQGTLRNHKRTHRVGNGRQLLKDVMCEICDRPVSSLRLEIHMILHGYDRTTNTFACALCQERTQTHELLQEHIKAFHADDKNSYVCHICSKVFARRNDLYSHAKTHISVKTSKCEICKKTFSNLANLKRHRFVHEDVKPFHCEQCQRGFTSQQNLNRHQAVHEATPKFECAVCAKKFKLRPALGAHITKLHPEHLKDNELETLVLYRKEDIEFISVGDGSAECLKFKVEGDE